ncbi:MAG: SusC/RagA family TonB-linked outer membrane protein, partial [Bacteroidota bacterium]
MEKKTKNANQLLLLLIFIFGVFTNFSMAANLDVSYADEKQLTLNAENITLQQAIQRIQDQSEFDFFYKNVDLEKTEKKVSLNFEGKTIHEVLPELLKGTELTYKVMEKDIVIFPSASEAIQENESAVDASRQQEIEVSGTVTDAETGDPLPGVNIVVQGTTTGTTTDTDGNYTIEAPADATLVFSFVGYQEQTIEINGQEQIDVEMEETVTELEEVVAIGYQQRARGEVTGSVSQASGVDIEEAATPDMEQSLQGKVPGLVVSDRGGNVGRQNMDFLVRGKSTLNNNSPLIVIDGVPRSSFGTLSPNDIENVSVLKDASAAIYGARAANGVILIQTKEGQSGEPEFTFQTEYGFQKETSYPTPMNSYERAKYYNEMYVNEGRQPMWSDKALDHFRKGDKPLEYPNTNWYDVAIADRAPQTHHNLSMRGGTETIQYYVSGDYLYQQGLLKSGDVNYNQYQLRSNITVQATDNLELGVNIEARVEKHEEPEDSNPWGDIISTYPWIKDRWPDGRLGPPTESMQNLITQSNREYGFDDETDKIFNAKINFNYDMPWITDGLELSGYANYNRELGDERTFYNIFPMYSYEPETGEYKEHTGFSRSHRGSRGVYSETDNSLTDFYHLRLSYDKSFGEHNVSAFAAYEQSESWYKSLGAYRKNLPSDEKPYLWAGGEAERDNWESLNESGRVNYFGSLSYNFARKYLIDFTLRYDGSFNFPKEKRFGLFPGVSLGYNISEEPFMEDIGWLDNLKLRASYAKMGNDDVPSYQYLAQYGTYNAFSFGLDPRIEKGMNLTVTPNPGITWENSYQRNVGFDITVMEGLFTLNMDYFYEQRRQILL